MINQKMKHSGEKRSAIRELFDYGNARKREIGAENVFDFSIGNPSIPAPKIVHEEIRKLLDEVPAAELHGYTSAPGAPEVRKAVSDYIQNAFHVPMRPELVFMTCGAAASLTVTLHALCNEGDEVIVIAPYFAEYRIFIEYARAVCVPVMSNEKFHLDFEALRAAINEKTKAIIINSPNNPTGVVYSREEIETLGKLLNELNAARKEPLYLIADEPYRELTFGAEVPYPPAYCDNTIVCYSFSKSLSLPGERIGYIAISPKAADADAVFFAACGAARSLGFVCAPALFQRVIMKCLGKSGDVEEYRRNRDLLYGALTSYGYECILPEGAFYLYVKSPEPDAKKFLERAKKYEILVVPSDSFGAEGYVRISYCVSHSTIERSLPAFEKLMKEYR